MCVRERVQIKRNVRCVAEVVETKGMQGVEIVTVTVPEHKVHTAEGVNPLALLS